MKLDLICKGILLITLVLVANCRCIQSIQTPLAAPDDVAVVFTSSMQGYVEPCGCTSEPLGGLARMASKIDEIKKTFLNRVIFIDAGNLLFESATKPPQADLCVDEVRTDLLIAALSNMGLVATVMGPFDQGRGLPFYRSLLTKHRITELNVAPDVLAVSPLIKPGIIIRQGEINIGFTAFRLEAGKETTFVRHLIEKEAHRLKTQGAQAVVVIAQTSLLHAQEVLTDLHNIDIAIIGQNPGEKPMIPIKAGGSGPWMVAAGQQGQYLGVLELRSLKQKLQSLVLDDRELKQTQRLQLLTQREKTLTIQISDEPTVERKEFLQNRLESVQSELEELKKPLPSKPDVSGASLTFKAVALTRDIKPNAEIQKQLDAFQKQIPELNAQCEKAITCPTPAANQAAFVGAETCKTCHAAAYEVWQKAVFSKEFKGPDGKWQTHPVGHAKAWATLEQVSKDKDRSCIGCHSAGFMIPGGYCKTNDVGKLKNVQCESCHGAGSLHAQTGNPKLIKGKVTESTCRECHHVPHIESTESFNFDTQVQRILGEGHGQALLKRLQHK